MAVQDHVERVPTSPHEIEAEAERGRGWYAFVARTGLVAKGISYGIVGLLAIDVALGNGGKATSRTGALETLAQHTFGKILLLLLAVGFAAYVIWRLVQAFAEREEDGDDTGALKKWGKRAGYLGRAVIYAGLTVSAVKILVGADTQSQNAKVKSTTGDVLSWPSGRWIVGAAGVAIIGVALWNFYRGGSHNFEDKWRAGMSSAAQKWGGRAGLVGHIARAVVFGLIGAFVIKAAAQYDPQEAIGLDGALRKLAAASYGPYLLGLTAAGLIAYGLYCFVDARYRDVSTGGRSGSAGGR